MMKHTASLWPALILLLALSGCADEVTTATDVSGTGAIGAPCQTADECSDGLACEENVCGPAEITTDTTQATDAEPSDTEIDASQTEDTGPTEDTASEDAPLSDTPLSDVPTESDIEDGDATSDAFEDAISDAVDWDTIKTDCEELGIANDWTGEFSGSVQHDLVIPEEWGVPPKDDLQVSGELTFSIECIDSKLKVDGKLDGFAVSAGENYPFTLNLEGYYNPATKKLNADIVDGMVLVILIEVYFTGVFDGELVTDEDGNESFTGTWFGEDAGTNAGELVQGTASAQGTWTASPTGAEEEETP